MQCLNYPVAFAFTAIANKGSMNLELHIPANSTNPIGGIYFNRGAMVNDTPEYANTQILNWAKNLLRPHGIEATDAQILDLVNSAIWSVAKNAMPDTH